MPPLRLSDAADLYNEAIQRTYGDRFEMDDMPYKKFVKENSTKLYNATESNFSGFGQAKILNENTSVNYVDPDEGYDVTWTQREFALGFQVTKKLWKFDRKGKYFALIKSLLINGENLRREAKATLSKQIRQIKNCLIGQLQRASEGTFNLNEAVL